MWKVIWARLKWGSFLSCTEYNDKRVWLHGSNESVDPLNGGSGKHNGLEPSASSRTKPYWASFIGSASDNSLPYTLPLLLGLKPWLFFSRRLLHKVLRCGKIPLWSNLLMLKCLMPSYTTNRKSKCLPFLFLRMSSFVFNSEERDMLIGFYHIVHGIFSGNGPRYCS